MRRKLPGTEIKNCDFGIQNGRQAAILDLSDAIFCAQVCPMGIYAHAKFGNPSFSGYENFPQKLISVSGRTTLDCNSPTRSSNKWAKNEIY